MSAPAGARGLQFTEVMRGHLLNRPSSFAWGEQAGRGAGLFMTAHLTIRIPDLAAFLADARHLAGVEGRVESPLLGGWAAIRYGTVQLLAPTADRDRRVMRYRLVVDDAHGQAWTVSGTKEVRNNLGPDLWRDTTTLRTNLFWGEVSADEESRADLRGTGILRLTVREFLRQLTTFRTNAPTWLGGARILLRFAAFFLGSLFQVYRLHWSWRLVTWPVKLLLFNWPLRTLERRPRPWPLFTLQGVLGAPPDTHAVETTDGLTLSLLRYKRGDAGDVVLLIPGLTTSSDMFIMPEHLNFVEYLLAHGFDDVFLLDGRISARHPHNLQRHPWSVDDVVLDNVAAIRKVKELVGHDRRLHLVSHSLGALSVSMTLAHTKGQGISRAVVNGAGLTPRGSMVSNMKLWLGPGTFDALFSVDYFNPRWGQQDAGLLSRLLARLVSFGHPECDVPGCHLLSYQWGVGAPVLYRHENLHEDTHHRMADLFGGSSFGYHRHMQQMIAAGERAVKRTPHEPRHQDLPADYLARAPEIRCPMLLVAGQENALMQDANVRFFEVLRRVPGVPHELLVLPGYGHCDPFIGQAAHRDVFPRIVEFLRKTP